MDHVMIYPVVMRSKVIGRIAAAVVGIAAVLAALLYMNQLLEKPVIQILASREPELGLPIYAQFVASQQLELASPVVVSKLVIPIVFFDSHASMAVRLYREGVLIQSWPTVSAAAGLHEIQLPLDPPPLVEGSLLVQFDGSSIAHNQQQIAPRVFVEPDDSAYPFGHYRIAANDKKGDIALSVYALVSRWSLFLQELRHNPARQLSTAGLWVAAWLMLMILPNVIGAVFDGQDYPRAERPKLQE
jgi:hypothetical protein